MQSKVITREELWAKQNISTHDVNYDLWNEKKKTLRSISSITNSFIFTVDVFKNQYNFASENFSYFFGLNSKWLRNIEKNGDFIEDRIHPDDRILMINKQIKHSQFIYSLSPEKRNDFQNIFQFRILNAKNEYVNVISRQQVFLKDSNNKAWIIIGIMNISADQNPLENIRYSCLNIKTGELIEPHLLSHSKKLLTQREYEVLQLIRLGLLSKEIAEKLNISIHTVNNHRKNILAKLEVDNSIEAVNIANNLDFL